MANDFLQFCSTDTGTNLLTESEYLASADRISGNKPGVASAKLVNRALRQSNYITSQLAQYISNTLSLDVVDDATPAKLLAQMMAALTPYAPSITTMLSSTGTYLPTYIFLIASGSATAAATYTNNGHTFTVKSTIASGTVLYARGNGFPSLSGTLTKSGGTGDATITFYAMRAPISHDVLLIGGGGGGGGSSTSAGDGVAGGAGGDTTFGDATAGGGRGGPATNAQTVGGVGGTVTAGSVVGIALAGGSGGGGGNAPGTAVYLPGGIGAAGPFGGAGGNGGYNNATPANAVPNSGSGGGGASCPGFAGAYAGAGGGAGAFIRGLITPTPGQTFSWGVGAKGALGNGGTGGSNGAEGSLGIIQVRDLYQ